MQDVFLFHKNGKNLSFGAFPSFPKRLMIMIPLFVESQLKSNSDNPDKQTMRPETPDDKKLGEGIRIRLTRNEKQLLMDRCRKEGYQTISDFGRVKLLRKREIRRIEASEEFAEIMGKMDFELNKIGVNLNQIAKKLNTYLGYQLDSEDKRTLNNSYETLKKCFLLLQKYIDQIP